MKNRKSFIFEEYSEETTLIVKTLCPEKWLLVDRETGQVYVGNRAGHWDRLDPVKKVDK